jgi:hypothetical protein
MEDKKLYKVVKPPYKTCEECKKSGITYVCWESTHICENYLYKVKEPRK